MKRPSRWEDFSPEIQRLFLLIDPEAEAKFEHLIPTGAPNEDSCAAELYPERPSPAQTGKDP